MIVWILDLLLETSKIYYLLMYNALSVCYYLLYCIMYRVPVNSVYYKKYYFSKYECSLLIWILSEIAPRWILTSPLVCTWVIVQGPSFGSSTLRIIPFLTMRTLSPTSWSQSNLRLFSSMLDLSTCSYCLFGLNYYIMLGSKLKECKPPRNDIKGVSVIEMTFLYDVRYSVFLLRQKKSG